MANLALNANVNMHYLWKRQNKINMYTVDYFIIIKVVIFRVDFHIVQKYDAMIHNEKKN